MAAISGPTSNMPGRTVADGLGECDWCGFLGNLHRVQGETDSFGAEYHDICAPCRDKMRDEVRKFNEQLQRCEWCGNKSTDTRETRDPDEGSYGPLYRVCQACRTKMHRELQKELDAYEAEYGDSWRNFGSYDDDEYPEF